MSRNYGLIGCPLGHSFSPQIHGYLGDYDYKLNVVEREDLERFVKGKTLDGYNVTIPHKVEIVQYLDEISDIAKRIGAVNTVVRKSDGKLFGTNTDYYGLKELLRANAISLENAVVLILGTGGAAQMAITLSEDLGAKEILNASRNPGDKKGCISYEDIVKHPDIEVVINATPVGMYPNIDNSPIILDDVPNCRGVVDLIANPVRSSLVLESIKRGIKASGGLRMLVAQAIKAYEIFCEYSQDPDMKQNDKSALSLPEQTDRIMKYLSRDVMNIVFVGMPGSGKTTAANLMGNIAEMPIIDTDDAIIEAAGISIPEIFERDGEAGFRDLEKKIIAEVSLKTGHIIATGGGAILKPENRNHLRANGYVVYLDAPIDILATDGRPLSKSREALEAMYEVRSSLYKECSDICIHITEDYKKCSEEIVEILADFVKEK